jgi:hypothetical protein
MLTNQVNKPLYHLFLNHNTLLKMPEGVINDLTDKGTKRPNAKPIITTAHKFFPMYLPDFDFEITLPDDVSLDDPISLFTMYYTSEIVKQIVQYTNDYQREPQDPTPLDSRAFAWYLTYTKEIWIYLAIRIYMTLFV